MNKVKGVFTIALSSTRCFFYKQSNHFIQPGVGKAKLKFQPQNCRHFKQFSVDKKRELLFIAIVINKKKKDMLFTFLVMKKARVYFVPFYCRLMWRKNVYPGLSLSCLPLCEFQPSWLLRSCLVFDPNLSLNRLQNKRV